MVKARSRASAMWVNAAILLGTTLLLCSEASGQRAGTVYRGLHPGGMWVELGDDGHGAFALSILDGMPGFAAEPLTVPMRLDRGTGGCRLTPLEQGLAIGIDGCPGGSAFSANITIGAVTGATVLQPVGWEGSFAWSDTRTPLGAVRQSCALQRLRGDKSVAGTVLESALAALASEAAAVPAASTDPAQTLPSLRAERLRSYSVLQLSAIEAEQARRIEDAVAGRAVLGRRVPMAEATQQKMEFDARVTNSPQRVQARQRLLYVDRSLSEIYDVAVARRRTDATRRLQQQLAPAALTALQQTLSARQPSRIEHLVALEGVVGDLDACLAAIDPAATHAQAHAAVRRSLASRAGELSEAINIAMASATDSDGAATVLAPFENNQAVREAMQAAGQGAVLAQARARITRLAQAEQRAAAAMMTAAGGGRGGGGFSAARVRRSVVFVYYESEKGGSRYTSRGTGFVVAPNIVVTNAHVVEVDEGRRTSPYLVIVNGDGAPKKLEATVLLSNNRVDMAILRVPGLQGTPVPIATREPSIGADLWVYGFPAEADGATGSIVSRVLRGDDRPLEASLSRGVVSRIVTGRTVQGGELGETRLVQYNAVSSGGGSGSPVFDACHRIIAIHAQGTSSDASEFNNGVSTTVLTGMLRSVGVTPAVSSAAC
ncbi:trypsin-like peptidase domain-containing protein [Caulobacter sp. SL161]|uniref:trypsin-like peptidase domain-containing protein n=1 Tax=Caulobacter sp. SL161 TaxID=2995156 RepID=UPI002272FBCE|nr:trypsin-like peptidase domain-containing protein [Caulobacter sp. SL161]MCY1647791.1 trypsin-like peptidase domain-containing protein [Caulobacter sp. SL161]